MVDRKASLQKDVELPFAYLRPISIAEETKERASVSHDFGKFECPVYSGPDRTNAAIIVYLPIQSEIPTETLLKRGTMLYIKT